MIINDLYKTTIKTSNDKYIYNLGETATIQVILTDYNNTPVQNKSVSVNIQNPRQSINTTNTYTTNSNGIAEITYTISSPSEVYVKCNDKTITLTFDGWEAISSETGNGVSVYRSLNLIKVTFTGNVAVTGSWKTLRTLSEVYRPWTMTGTMVNWGNTVCCTVNGGGSCSVRDTSGKSWTPGLSAEVVYPRVRG